MNWNIILITMSICLSGLTVAAEEKALADYSETEALALIDKGGGDLIKKHGEEMLQILYFKKKPTDEELREMVANHSGLKITKQDYPVLKALKSGGEVTLEMLRRTEHFNYPLHPMKLEGIAYLLFELKGLEGAIQFAETQIAAEKTLYAVDNWRLIIDMMNRPELPKGLFFIKRTVEGRKIKPTKAQVREQRIRLKHLSSQMQEAGSRDFLNNHCRFHKILQAVLQFKSKEGKWPDSLFQLVQIKSLNWSEIGFIDSEGFTYVPRLLRSLENPNRKQKIMWLSAHDGKYVLEGFLNGEIKVQVVQTQNGK